MIFQLTDHQFNNSINSKDTNVSFFKAQKFQSLLGQELWMKERNWKLGNDTEVDGSVMTNNHQVKVRGCLSSSSHILHQQVLYIFIWAPPSHLPVINPLLKAIGVHLLENKIFLLKLDAFSPFKLYCAFLAYSNPRKCQRGHLWWWDWCHVPT